MARTAGGRGTRGRPPRFFGFSLDWLPPPPLELQPFRVVLPLAQQGRPIGTVRFLLPVEQRSDDLSAAAAKVRPHPGAGR